MEQNKKQETLKEAAERYSQTHQDVSAELSKYLVKAVFMDGAKWQAERMYSEEEVEKIAIEMVMWTINNFGNINAKAGKKFDEIIEQFKKK